MMKMTLNISLPKDRLRRVLRKRKLGDVLIQRLRMHFLYSKLCSLLLPQPLEYFCNNGVSSEMVIEYEPAPDEIPGGDFDEENAHPRTPPAEEKEDDDAVVCGCHDSASENDNDGDDVDENEKAFVPSIKIKRIMDDALLISVVVLKNTALSSALFLLLEEEKLDIVFENQYRTETKVSHTIQVRIPEEYDSESLERKLQTWARTGTRT